MFIKEKIETTKFSPSEQVIVNYLLQHLDHLDTMTTASLAQATYSSKSTVVSMTKRLNFSGWASFKQALMKEIAYFEEQDGKVDANFPFLPTDNALQIARKVADVKRQAIEETAHLNDFAALTQACDLLLAANHVHVFALGNNLLISQEFVYNMRRIQQKIDIYRVQGEGLMSASLTQKGEVAIIVSYSGGTDYLVNVAKILKTNQVPIILISNMGESTLSGMADLHLKIATREKLYSKISTFSIDAAVTYLFDVLYALVFSRDYQRNLATRQRSSRLIETSRRSDSSILREI